MSDWIDGFKQEVLSVGEKVVIDVEGTDVAIFNIAGEFYALEDVCTHDGTEIASGELIGDEIVCPRHGARFCVKTGEVKCAPAYENIATFAIRIKNGVVQVRDSRWD